MRIPEAGRAVLDISKLEDYCLDRRHLRCRHKAQMFRSALGLDRSDAEWLRGALLEGVRDCDAVELITDAFGARWRADIAVERQNRRAVVRSIWIVRTGENFPRFVTCWVL